MNNNDNQNSVVNNVNSNSNMVNNNYHVAYNPNYKKTPITYAKFILILSIFLLIAIVIVWGKDIFFADKHKTVEKKQDGITAVVSDNVYEKARLDTREDAEELITIDSDTQKAKCFDEEVKKIERRLEVKHDIVAVNLCEMDKDFALELEKTVDRVFEEFPTVKGYLTNITLTNPPEGTNYIASFTATQLFAKSNSVDTYPHAYKMIMNLNASYFLDLSYLESSVKQASDSGYFPENANRSSVVAHEFGHYISFIALLRSTFLDDTLLLTNYNYERYLNLVNSWNRGDFSKKLISEAYGNYKKKYKNNDISEEDFRASISGYAVVTDNKGEPVYDETIAEAFHDMYLHGKSAKPASLEIIKVLRKYMNGYVEK